MKKIGLSTVYVLFFSFAFLSFAGAQVQGPTSVVVNTTHTYSYYTNNVLGNPNWVIAVGGGGTILNQWQGSGGGYTAVYYASVQWTTTGSKTLRLRNYEMPVAEAYITVQAAPPLATPIANEATNISANSFTVSWSAVTGATSYFLEVSTTSTFTNGILHQYTTSATSYTVSNRLPSTTYHYRVKAVASGNQSNFSTSKTVKTIPPTPSAQARTRCGPGNVTLNSDQPGYVAYEWYDQSNALLGTTTSNSLTVPATGLTSYKVRIKDVHNNWSAFSSNAAITTTHNTLPMVDQLPACGPGAPIRVNVTYDGENAADYYIEWYDAETGYDGAPLVSFLVPANDDTYYIEQLQLPANQEYWVGIYDPTTAQDCRTARTDIIIEQGTAPSSSAAGYMCVTEHEQSYTAHIQAYGNDISTYNLYKQEGSSYSLVQSGSTSGTFTVANFNYPDDVSNYYVRGVSSQGCWSQYQNVSIDVINPPLPSLGGDNEVCPGQSATLTASGGYAGYYRWYEGSSTTPIPNETESVLHTASLTTPTSYKVSYITTGANGQQCESPKNTIAVGIKPESSVTGFSVSPGTEFYGNSSPTLTFSHTTSVGSVTYEASTDGSNWSPASSTVSEMTYFHAKAVNSDCDPAYSNVVIVSLYLEPVITVEEGTNYLSYGTPLHLSTSNYYSYQWVKDGNDIAGATQQHFVVTEPGVYTIKVKGSGTAIEAVSQPITVYDNALQSQNVNYISTITFLKENQNQSALYTVDPDYYTQSTTYYDGLGRPLQTVVAKGSPQSNDVVQPVVYDAYGREAHKYMPFVYDGKQGLYVANSSIISASTGDYVGAAAPFYDSPETRIAEDDGDMPFARTVFEPSPLNRVIEQGAPGAVWQPGTTHTVKKAYETNGIDEVRLWTYSLPNAAHPLGLIVSTGHYLEDKLYKNVTTDEHGNDVIEYVDKEGRTVLKRVQALPDGPNGEPPAVNDINYASTYYVYDDFGNLVCVIQPEGAANINTYLSAVGGDDKEAFLTNWTFRYRYDERRRMIMKQVPGADSILMVYDKRDRLVLTQDGNQRDANEWLFTKYDELNRPVMTGTYTHGSQIDRDDMSALLSPTPVSEIFDGTATNYGYSNNVFPTSNVAVLTVTYYDKYDFKSLLNDPNGLFDFKNDELTAHNALKAQEQAYFPRVQNLVTGSATRILNSSTFLWSVNYYDDRYRLIQSTTSNHKNGVDRTTNVYDFVGKVLRTKSRYIIPGHAMHSDTKISKRFSYDHAGRLLKTWHQIEGGPDVVISSNEYNELGQLVTKRLHQTTYDATTVTADPLADQAGTNYDKHLTSSSYSSTESTYVASNSIRLLPGFTVPLNSTFQARIGYSAEDASAYNDAIEGEYLQSIDYRYNIRGWLKRINDPAAPVSEDLFNMELHYNTPTANGGDPQYNGNISEAVWKSAGLDKQSYGYNYDAMSRIMESKYYNLAKPTQNGRYDEIMGDPADLINYPAYDLNGNIQNLVRNGKTAEGTYTVMDKLNYKYKNADLTHSGNQLMYVTDNIATGTDEQGFKELSTAEGAADYLYDENGNLEKDENKGIIDIDYNHLNLPSKVLKSATEYIVYTYDAAGRRLAQQVFGTEAKTTEYMGEMVFEDNSLQFILHDEGRALPATEIGPSDPWEYQYHLKDHLRNVRLMFTSRQDEKLSIATLETINAANEQAEFLHYDEAVKVNYDLFDHTYDGTTGNTYYSTRLTGGNTNAVYGLATSLSVLPGDTIKMQVFAKYLDPNSSNWTPALASFMAAIAGGTAPQGTVVDGGTPGSVGGQSFPFAGVFDHSTEDNVAPKAYLNFIVFDRDYNPILAESGYVRITPASREYGNNAAHDLLKKAPLVIKEPGYVYIYLSNENETSVEVFFDDLEIQHVKSPVVHIDDYYPFGLTFNSYRREKSLENRIRFQGQEHIDDLELGWVSFKWRNHNPSIARFFNVDPIAMDYVYNSPYAFSENHVTSHIELEGLEKWSIKNIDKSPGTISGPWKDQATAQAYARSSPTENGYIRSSTMQRQPVSKLEQGKFKTSPKGIVLHRTVNNSTDQTVRSFQTRGFGTHFIVGQDGVVTQTASLERWTQHVGKPSAENPGVTSSNSVGIEVVGNYNYETEQWEPLTEDQVMAVSNLVNTLYDLFGLTYTDVYNHEDLSAKTQGEGEVVRKAVESCINNCEDEE